MQKQKVLDNQVIKQLFGANHMGVVVYDYASDTYNNVRYHGQPMQSDAECARKPAYRTFKSQLDKNPQFSDMFELVGFAAMTINCPKFVCDESNISAWRLANIFVKNPVYDRRGLQVVGTIIVRDKKTGQILPVPDRWMLLMDGRLLTRGKSYVDGAQKNLDSVRAYHGRFGASAKSAKTIERYERKLYTAQRIANCENRIGVAMEIYWQMPVRGADVICDAYRNNAVLLYNQAHKCKKR